MAERVRTHTRRTASGATTKVTSHSRKGRPRRALISPGHSWKLFKKAFTKARSGKKVTAVALGLLGLTELTAWLTLEGVSLILATAGVLALAVGVAGAGLGGLHK
jgi:hypothetical protein